MQAFAEGKTIEYSSDGKFWSEIDVTSWTPGKFYRIKPEPKYRPFKNKEECWQEMQKHQPFGWIRNTDTQCLHNITSIGYNNHGICLDNSIMHFDTTFNDFTFADGAPFGVKEE